MMDRHDGLKLGVVRGISFGVFGPPDVFMPQIRALGAGLARLYITWNEVEPEPGRYDWRVVDALLGQLESGDEIWVTVVSSSRWATQQATDFLPASPANDLSTYLRFVEALVGHCRGTIAYWQCNNEPSNAGLWAGSAEEYAAQAIAFADAVRRTDRTAKIVLGGCGYDVLSAPSDASSRRFFGEVLDRARSAFDLFAIHLYDDPRRIADHIADARAMMRGHGYERPMVVGEYGGPTLLEFPGLDTAMQQVMMEAFSGAMPSLDSADLSTANETPDRKAMRSLYARMAELPPELQMFMQGCPPGLVAKRNRIACREIVTRNLLALSSGVTRTLCWNLAPEVPNYRDPFNLMGFLSDKLALMDFEFGAIGKREPPADSFRLLADMLADATTVTRLDSATRIVAIEIKRAGRDTVHVFWAKGDTFIGEDNDPVPLEWPWPHPAAAITDVFGSTRTVASRDVTLSLGLSTTPIYVRSA
jgi:hypothetical protein